MARAWTQAHFGAGAGPVLLGEVHCTGNELSVEQCPRSPWGEHNCGHGEDAGVSCTPLTGKTPAPAPVIKGGPAPAGVRFPALLSGDEILEERGSKRATRSSSSGDTITSLRSGTLSPYSLPLLSVSLRGHAVL